MKAPVLNIAFVLSVVSFLLAVEANDKETAKKSKSSELNKEARANAKLPPCAACSNLVSSFEKGMDRTARGKLEGGDTAWEEKTQSGGYATSEVRFVEIQERLCRDVDRGEHQCHADHHEWEERLEEWWKLNPDTRPNLKSWLCVDKLKVCCPENAYGADCKPCSQIGFNGKICSDNGKCKGAGSRKGNGLCSCDKGYTGPNCDKCSDNHYEAYRDENKLVCTECHAACVGSCTGSGPKACLACKAGYNFDPDHGCVDIDECRLEHDQQEKQPAEQQQQQPMNTSVCPEDKFCVNTEGSFNCLSCDRACASCHADGPEACNTCATGYVMNADHVCISDNDAATEPPLPVEDHKEETESDTKEEL